MDNRPVLIIGCSARKFSKNRIFDLYDGQIFRLIRSNLSDSLRHLNIYILSAKYGLCSCDSMQCYESYEEVMTSATIPFYIQRHKDNIITTLNSLLDKEIHIVLPKVYLAVLTSSFSLGQPSLDLNTFSNVHIQAKPRGIGDHQRTIKLLLNRFKGE